VKNSLILAAAVGSVALSAASALPSPAASPTSAQHSPVQARRVAESGPLGGYSNVVVIFEENHSFDNLYGSWGKVNGQRVNGLQQVRQVTQGGTTYDCLLQNDVNLTSPSPLATTCTDSVTGTSFASHFTNGTFMIDDVIAPTDKTCPPDVVGTPFHPNGWLKDSVGAVTGGCTEDLVHRFYQEQYQLDGGRQDRYVTGSDAVGLTMGVYDTKRLPIYQYLHSAQAPNYVLADNFFQAAYGGSFLNHQFLIAGRAPLDTSNGALGAKSSVPDANGMVRKYPLYTPTSAVVDGQLTQACAGGGNDYSKACGSYAVNTVQPSSLPAGSGAKIPLIDDAQYPNIGDAMNAGDVSWNWYAGGWDAAVAGNAGADFQYHHQPFNYFADYAAGGSQRSHLQDETDFLAAATAGTLPQVSFVKPYGTKNEHPGYASESDGSDHLVDLVKAITSGPQGKDTLIIVTYDEFGGQFDHVAPTPVDAFGDGTRIPALFISAGMQHSGVDHTRYDTVSILRTIEDQFGLNRLGADSRDVAVANLSNVVEIGGHKSNQGVAGRG